MAKAKTITIKRDEARAYEALRAWADRAEPLRFLVAVLNSRPVVAGDPDPQKWFVPSASHPGVDHVVDIILRVCDCVGWMYNKHQCSHLDVADCAARLRLQVAGLASSQASRESGARGNGQPDRLAARL